MPNGCVILGAEWVELEPYNAAVRLMITVFGPMAGTYDGPYPTIAQAKAALAHSVDVPADQLWIDRVPMKDTTIELDVGVGSALLRTTRWAIVTTARRAARTSARTWVRSRLQSTTTDAWFFESPTLQGGSHVAS